MGNEDYNKKLEELFKNSGENNSGADNDGMGKKGNMPNWGKPKKKKKGLIITLVIIVVLILLFLSMFSIADKKEENNDSAIGVKHSIGKYIAEIKIDGVIEADESSGALSKFTDYNHAFTMELIDELVDDDDNVGMMIIINSPGGGIYETDELYEKIMDYKKDTGRPVFAYFKNMAASGGYYLACAADKIYSNRNTLTGSIGVTMGEVYDITEFLKQHGIKANAVISGRNKAMGSITQPFTQEQKDIFQTLVDDGYQRFVEIVAKGRKMPVEKVKMLADGRIYTAKQALNANMIDKIGRYDDLKWDILKKTNEDSIKDIEFETFEPYEEDETIFSILKKLSMTGKGDINTLLDFVNSNTMPISYTDEYLMKMYIR